MAVAVIAAAAATLALSPAAAQKYPDRPVHLLVPYGPGGVADVGMRMLTDKLSKNMHQQFVVENRPGAGGIVAAKAELTAPPDGYTLLMTGNNNAISTGLFRHLPYNILTDFESTSTTSFFDLLIITREKSPLNGLQDIIKAAKAKPGKLNVGSINPGSTQNLAAELFKSVAGIQIAIVPFRTSADMATSLLRGDIDIAFEFYAASQGLIHSGKVKVLASTGPERTAYLPKVATAKEQGLKDFEVTSWNGISVPKGTPKAVIKTLGDGLRATLPDKELQAKSQQMGMLMRGSTPEAMDARMKADIAKWGAVIDKAGIPKRD
jgi:tripartite-type tricarboxylate transporter receptor subunit TctC